MQHDPCRVVARARAARRLELPHHHEERRESVLVHGTLEERGGLGRRHPLESPHDRPRRRHPDADEHVALAVLARRGLEEALQEASVVGVARRIDGGGESGGGRLLRCVTHASTLDRARRARTDAVGSSTSPRPPGAPRARSVDAPHGRQVVVDGVGSLGFRRSVAERREVVVHLDGGAALQLADLRGGERLGGRGRDRLAGVQLASASGLQRARSTTRRPASAAHGARRR